MSLSTLPSIPPQLKPISHFMKVATEHETRDPVIAYWCRFYAVQKSLQIDKSSPEARTFLMQMLNYLEGKKKELSSNEAVTIESVGEAHIENYALKLFHWADSNDRQNIFNKNVVKAFYTSGILFDILENFGEVSEEFQKTRKYAKWKAAYIHNCLKNGETPIPGPANEDEDEEEEFRTTTEDNNPSANSNIGWTPQQHQHPNQDSSSSVNPIKIPNNPPAATNTDYSAPQNPQALSIEQIAKAQKYCKWAGSALNFDDVPTAIENLTKALKLLQTGNDE